jgi:peptidyl-prolyl cis-trans isomerase B (cyclophilin B)
MVTTALATVLLGQTLSGPKIVVTLNNNRKFVIQTDQKGSPKSVKYIGDLVKKDFYSGILVHRVESWVVQWGDPLTKKGMNTPGIGTGGTGKTMAFEGSKISFKRGVVGIASTAAKAGGDCQIFVLTRDMPHLDGNYAVLGKVVQGMDVVDKMKIGDKVVSMKLASIPVRKTGPRG